MSFVWFLLSAFFLSGCSIDDANGTEADSSELTEVFSARISVPEPSGLSLHINGKSLWTVSDQTAQVYQISLKGQLLKTLSYRGQDLEGISQSPLDGSLWIVEERKREMVQLDTLGNELARHKVSVEVRDENSGLEGIVANPNNDHLFVLNEKMPALFMNVSSDATVRYSKTIHYVNDCSGIAAEANGAFLWMVSDESRTIVKCDTSGSEIESYRIGVDKAEGIAVSRADSLIYIVSDSKQKLYIYQMK